MSKKIYTLLMVSFLIVALSLPGGTGLAGGPPGNPQPAAPFVPGEILVGLESGADVDGIARALGADEVRVLGGGRIFLLGVDGDAREQAGKAAGLPGVRFAEPNWLRQIHDEPNDGGYDLKWDLHNDGSLCGEGDCATADADMDWQEAYTALGSGFDGSAVVAVIDTGIDFTHPDLNDKITAGYDYLDGDGDPEDTYGHGTHVTGIALAETNNGSADGHADTAGVGYSPNIQVMPLRVCDSGGCPTSAIVDAIYHAADNGANVINLSLGGKIGSSSEEQAINYAWDNGLVIAASSGNDGAGRVSYPAAFANAIAVGSTNWHDNLAPYSNKGNDLDVVAPGGDMSDYHDPGGIYSTMPTYDVYLTTSFSYAKNYDQLQGTSMAAPQVSGLAGLLFAVGVADADEDGKTNDEIRAIIESTADDLGASGWDREFGWGRVNVNSAVLAATGGTDGGGGGDGGASEMYVWDIAFSQKDYGPGGSFHDLSTTVTVQADSDGDSTAESKDDPVANASVGLTLTHDTDGDGTFECGVDDDCWNFSSTTDSSGQVAFTLKRAPTGDYQAEVTSLTHSTYTWNSSLDAGNPDTYTLQ